MIVTFPCRTQLTPISPRGRIRAASLSREARVFSRGIDVCSQGLEVLTLSRRKKVAEAWSKRR